MEELQIIEEKNDEIFKEISSNRIDFDYLKSLNETKQSFLKVNNFTNEEPDFRDLTSDDFIDYIENHKNTEIIKKIKEIGIEEDFRSSMSQIYTSKNGKKRILIFFLPIPLKKANVGIDVVQNFLKLLPLLDCIYGVLITENSLTSKSNERMELVNTKNTSEDNVYNVVHYEDSMFINISEHCLTPEVLKVYTGKELEDFLEEENVNKKLFPKILVSDPVSKFYMARVGDVIKMKRMTGTQDTLVNEQIVYRLVIYGKFKK